MLQLNFVFIIFNDKILRCITLAQGTSAGPHFTDSQRNTLTQQHVMLPILKAKP